MEQRGTDFTGPRDFLDKLLMERSYEHYREGFRRQDLSRDDSAWTPYGKKPNGWDSRCGRLPDESRNHGERGKSIQPARYSGKKIKTVFIQENEDRRRFGNKNKQDLFCIALNLH